MSEAACTCETSRPAFCPTHKCDCNIWCDCSNKRNHIFAPGEWCGGGRQWTERRPGGGSCRVHLLEVS